MHLINYFILVEITLIYITLVVSTERTGLLVCEGERL